MLQGDRDPVSPQLDRPDLRHEWCQLRSSAVNPSKPHLAAEAELADAARLVVVPEHHFVGGEARRGTSAHKGKQVAPEQHLDHGHACPIKLSPELHVHVC